MVWAAAIAPEPIASFRSAEGSENRMIQASPCLLRLSGHYRPNRTYRDNAGVLMTPQEVMPVMRCHPVHGCQTGSEGSHRQRIGWLSLVVGLPGLEPGTSSLSEIDG